MKKRNGYLVLGYACNESCRCCPIKCKKDQLQFSKQEDLLFEASKMIEYGITDVTISGGEPTLHPNFLEMVAFFLDRGVGVHILSNGERFFDQSFADAFISLANKGELTVTTTFHSYIAEEHEYQNGTPGSFRRSLKGLQYLDQNNLCISVKHCITSKNYYELPQFMHFLIDAFSPRTELQFWGIDLCGLDDCTAKESFIDFSLIRHYMQNALDIFERSRGNQCQALTLNNLPLCMCDCYYWKYFSTPEYDIYIDHKKDGEIWAANSGTVATSCKQCTFRDKCMGAYISNFEKMGDSIVSVPVIESRITSFRNTIRCFTSCSVSALFYSPHTEHRLTCDGYYIENRLSGGKVVLRLRAEQILHIQRLLSKGALPAELGSYLGECGLNGEAVASDLLRKGIIE